MKTNENLLKALDILQTVASLDMTIVPIEPTIDMIEAGQKIAPEITEKTLKNIYAAMIYAHDEKILI